MELELSIEIFCPLIAPLYGITYSHLNFMLKNHSIWGSQLSIIFNMLNNNNNNKRIFFVKYNNQIKLK